MLMQEEIVGLFRRLVALMIDCVMLYLVYIPIWLAIREMTPSPISVWVLAYITALLYSTIFLSKCGRTPGKIMTSLRIIGADGGALTQRQAFLRSLIKWTPVFAIFVLAAALTPVPTPSPPSVLDTPSIGPDEPPAASAVVVSLVGLAVAVVLMSLARRHPDRQALHDRIADTFVIRFF